MRFKRDIADRGTYSINRCKKLHWIYSAKNVVYSINLGDIYAGQMLAALLTSGIAQKINGDPVFHTRLIEVANEYAEVPYRIQGC
jgi:hypothetical protein